MLLEIDKSVRLSQSAEAIWNVVRDPIRVASCIPNVRDFVGRDEPGAYGAVIEDKLGPFRVEVPVVIQVEEASDDHRLAAAISGHDRRGQARVRGEVTALVVGEADGASLVLTSRIEVLGKLAALGAVPMRRRADQIFETFVRNLTAVLS
jgi:carbon monoxide dehydrogenase subunit G